MKKDIKSKNNRLVSKESISKSRRKRSYAFFYSTKYFYEHFNSYWSVRPIGFGIATIIFGLLTTVVLGEIPNQRIIISLILACVILYINIQPNI